MYHGNNMNHFYKVCLCGPRKPSLKLSRMATIYQGVDIHNLTKPIVACHNTITIEISKKILTIVTVINDAVLFK